MTTTNNNTEGPAMNAYNPNDRSTWRNDSSGTWHLPSVSIPFESYEQAKAYRDDRPNLAGRTIFPKVYNWSELASRDAGVAWCESVGTRVPGECMTSCVSHCGDTCQCSCHAVGF